MGTTLQKRESDGEDRIFIQGFRINKLSITKASLFIMPLALNIQRPLLFFKSLFFRSFVLDLIDILEKINGRVCGL
jgi:hypothetical protein